MVYDLLGRTVLTARAAGSELRLRLGDRPPGVYFVRIEQADGVRTLRFVKR